MLDCEFLAELKIIYRTWLQYSSRTSLLNNGTDRCPEIPEELNDISRPGNCDI